MKFPVIDMCRTLLAFLVVMIHKQTPFTPYYEWMYPVAVPGFFVISGFLMGVKGDDSYRRSMRKMFYYLVVSSLIYLPIYIWVGRFRPWDEWQSWFDMIVWNQPILLETLWFLGAYLYVLVFFRYTRRFFLDRIPLATIIFIVMAIIRVAVWALGVENFYYRNWLVEGIPYFLLGMLIRYWYDRGSHHFLEHSNLVIALLARIGQRDSLYIYIIHPLLSVLSGYTLMHFFIFRAAMWWMSPVVLFVMSLIVSELYVSLKGQMKKR